MGRLSHRLLAGTPQSITVITKPLMESQGATSLASALRNVPGLTIGAAEGGQIGTNINLNGFSARTDIYLDGMRDRAQYYRDTFALDSVEVLFVDVARSFAERPSQLAAIRFEDGALTKRIALDVEARHGNSPC